MHGPIGQYPGWASPGGHRWAAVLLSGLLLVTFSARSIGQRPSDRAKAGSNANEFRSVRDNVPLGLRDTAALVRLLQHARAAKPAEKAKADTDASALQAIAEHPERFRGVPLLVEGIARRLYSSQSPIGSGNRLFEVWITTGGKSPNPIACIVEELPAGFPDRPVISEHAVVRGFFLKLMAYKVGEKEFVAPVVVGVSSIIPDLMRM